MSHYKPASFMVWAQVVLSDCKDTAQDMVGVLTRHLRGASMGGMSLFVYQCHLFQCCLLRDLG